MGLLSQRGVTAFSCARHRGLSRFEIQTKPTQFYWHRVTEEEEIVEDKATL
jgi:hypothetical protein